MTRKKEKRNKHKWREKLNLNITFSKLECQSKHICRYQGHVLKQFTLSVSPFDIHYFPVVILRKLFFEISSKYFSKKVLKDAFLAHFWSKSTKLKSYSMSRTFLTIKEIIVVQLILINIFFWYTGCLKSTSFSWRYVI